MSTTKGFIFDYSKCVGCHACMVACFVENGIKPPLSWRKVTTYNKEKLPLLGFVHQSLACNHCKEAPCKKACPSNSFSFDNETGAVIHNKDRCIGCKYCTWVCPFDAPKYNPESGLIEKCHFCYHRLKEGQIPACAMNCPTGALSFGDIEKKAQPEAVGFSERKIFPRIKVIGDNIVNSIPEMDVSASGVDFSNPKIALPQNQKDEFNALHEFPLALFTLIGAFITGWFWAGVLPDAVDLPFLVFLILGSASIALSTFHLGKPIRAYYSVFNLKTSWISREILFFGIFLLLGMISLYFKSKLLLFASAGIGLLFLASVEKIYSVMVKKFRTPIHSANTMLTAFTFAALFAQLWSILIVFLAVKTMLFTIRTGASEFGPKPFIALVAFVRLIVGFFIPFGFLAFTENSFSWWIALSILSGELIDRVLYYTDIEPERPFLKGIK